MADRDFVAEYEEISRGLETVTHGANNPQNYLRNGLVAEADLGDIISHFEETNNPLLGEALYTRAINISVISEAIGIENAAHLVELHLSSAYEQGYEQAGLELLELYENGRELSDSEPGKTRGYEFEPDPEKAAALREEMGLSTPEPTPAEEAAVSEERVAELTTLNDSVYGTPDAFFIVLKDPSKPFETGDVVSSISADDLINSAANAHEVQMFFLELEANGLIDKIPEIVNGVGMTPPEKERLLETVQDNPVFEYGNPAVEALRDAIHPPEDHGALPNHDTPGSEYAGDMGILEEAAAAGLQVAESLLPGAGPTHTPTPTPTFQV